VLDLSGPGSATLSFGTRAGYADAAETPHTQTTLTLFPDVTLVTEIRNLKDVADVDGLGMGIQIHGTEGSVVWKAHSPTVAVLDPAGMPVKTITGEGNHFEKHVANFLAAVRAHDPQRLAAEIGEGVQSTALCHLGNISYRLGTDLAPEEIAARIDARQPKNDAAKLVDRVRRMLAVNGCEPAGGMVRCGEWVETAAGKETSALALTADTGPVLVEGPARDLERLEYRAPFLLPPARE
jgi:hypothetical protein